MRTVLRRRPSLAVRGLAAGAVAAPAAAIGAPAAWAHSELKPAAIGAGLAAKVTLVVEDERSNVGTTDVRLLFPDGKALPVVEVPTSPGGWTSELEGAQPDGTATGIHWKRATASPKEDPELVAVIGPVSATPTRAQFKVIQTYADGSVDRWIEAWPEGAREPAKPGPVLQVVAGGPGTSIAPTTTVAPPTTTAATASTTTSSTLGAIAAPEDEDGGSNVALVVVVAVGVAIAAIGGGALVVRRQRSAE